MSACENSTEGRSVEHVSDTTAQKTILVGADQTDQYLKFLEGKRVALVANQSSRIGNIHLVDTLLSLGLDIKKIFTPEHGFRGLEDAGAKINNQVDEKTSLPLISLYGNNKKPAEDQLSNIDIIVFDLQDVGVRFYTYLSTLHYIMQAAAENQIAVMVLDRPNPHMDALDGPLMKEEKMSFVGLHPVPILYGMSIGEYAKMINGENWLGDDLKAQLILIGCKNLNRKNNYQFPTSPSPNLPNMASIANYPSLALFEGTPISVGRGTSIPFQQIGHPALKAQYQHSFVPQPAKGAKDPKLNGEKCFGVLLNSNSQFEKGKLNLKYLIDFYQNYPNKKEYFNSFFDLLAGNAELKNQIIQGLSEPDIKKSWEADLEKFRVIREKYLIYK